MSKTPDWIIVSQNKEDLLRYSGSVVWINKCLRCKQEEPTYAGTLSTTVFQGKEFIKIHRNCK